MREDFDAAEIVRELDQAPGQRLSFRELADACAIPRARRPRFRRFLKQLLREVYFLLCVKEIASQSGKQQKIILYG